MKNATGEININKHNLPYSACLLCPRRCGVNRNAGERGFCGETAELRLGFAGIHMGEEPPITGEGGSGTVFVTGCNLGCAFCQNYQVSQKGMGRIVSAAEFADICLALQDKGAENINIVTGSHAAPAIACGIETGRKQGLSIPVLWNSSGYDGMETLEILKDFVDIYLPDLKTLDSKIAARFFNAADYPEHATAAILKMMENSDKMVIIRHLIIPGYLDNTRQVLRWFAENCHGRAKGTAQLSLMTQYTPVHAPAAKTAAVKTAAVKTAAVKTAAVKTAAVKTPGSDTSASPDQAIPSSFLSEDEYDKVISMLDEFGIEDGFCQELVTGSDWLPDFNRVNPFSSYLSIPVWHWKA